jgi:ubiquinone/menaquinone biosynthesis C-methylase UbiE
MTAIAKSEARSWRSFDRVARIYEGAERALFGQRLQAARTAGLDDLASPRRALLLGEGDGRFAAALLARFPNCEVHILDGSAQMLELARQRTQAHARVKTIHADAREYEFSGQYDLVTTLFFLDCFGAEDQSRLLERISAVLSADALWLYADFDPGPGGIRGLRHQLLLWLLYGGFGLLTDIKALRYHDPLPRFASLGFVPRAPRHKAGLLRSLTLSR